MADEGYANDRFERKLINRESGGDASIVNKLGFAGLYQFGAPRLQTLGVYTPGANEDLGSWNTTPKNYPGKWSGTFNVPGHPEIKSLNDFLTSPDAQRAVFKGHTADFDRKIAEKGLEAYIGQKVGGVEITREGIYAMAHLGGMKGAERALKGQGNAADANGSTVLGYARLGSSNPYAGTMETPSYRSRPDFYPAKDADYFDAASSAIRTMDTIHMIRGQQAGIYDSLQSHSPDPNFKFNETHAEKMKDFTDGERDYVYDRAHSEGHFDKLMRKVQDERRDEEAIGQAGLVGSAMQLGSAILDPIGLASGASALKIGRALMGVAATRKGRAVQNGLIGFGSTLPSTALQNEQNPNFGLNDFLLQSVAGIAIGAGLGHGDEARILRERGKHMQAETVEETQKFLQDGAKRAERDVFEREGGKVTPAGEEFYGPVRPQAAGAERADRSGEISSALSHGRIDVQGELLHEGNIHVKEMARDLMPDHVGDGGKTLADSETAFEWMTRHFEGAESAVTRPVADAFNDYAKDMGLSLMQKLNKKDDFLTEVGRAIFDPASARHPAVEKAAQVYRDQFQSILKKAKEAGADWAKNVDENDWYFPIMFDKNKVRALEARFGEDGMVSVIKQGFQAANSKYGDFFAEKYAGRVAKREGTAAVKAERPGVLAGAREDRDAAITGAKDTYHGDAAHARDEANAKLNEQANDVGSAKAVAGDAKAEARAHATEARAEAADLKARGREAYEGAVEDGNAIRADAKKLREEAKALHKDGKDAYAATAEETRSTRLAEREKAELRAIDLVAEADEAENLAMHLGKREARAAIARAESLRAEAVSLTRRADDLQSGRAITDDAKAAAAPHQAAAKATREEAQTALKDLRERLVEERKARDATYHEAGTAMRRKLDEASSMEEMAHELVRSARQAAHDAAQEIRSARNKALKEASDQHKVSVAKAKRDFASSVKTNLDEAFSEAFTRAFGSHFGRAKDLFAERAARRYYKTVKNVTEGTQSELANATVGADREALKRMLRESGLSELEAEAIAESLKPAGKVGPGHFRRRAPIDDVRAFTPEGHSTGEAFSLRDMTNMNADEVFSRYARQTLGHAAMARAGFQSRGAFSTRVTEITKGLQNTVPGYTDSLAAKHQSRLEMYGKRIYGDPLEDMNSNAYKLKTILSNVNFARFMQQSGVAQLHDAPRILMRNGIKAAWDNFALGDIARAFRKGSTSHRDELARDLEIFTGVGGRTGKNKITGRFGDMEDFYPDTVSDKAMDRAVNMSRRVANLTANVSLMNPMTDFLQRWSSRATLQSITDVARGLRLKGESAAELATLGLKPGELGPKMAARRKLMNDMGLSEDMLKRIGDLTDHMEFSERGVIHKLNAKQLSNVDSEAFDRLMAVVAREARHQVLDTTPGNLPAFFQSQNGRLFMQFKSFMFASYSANTLHDLKMGPAYMAKALIMGMAWSSMVHMLTVFEKSIGRHDQTDYLNEHLNPKALLAASFERSSVSGILPSIYDTAAMVAEQLTGKEDLQLFNKSRSSDLASNFVTGNPTSRTASALWDLSVGMPSDMLRGDKVWTQQEFRDRMSLVNPFSTTYGALNAMNAMAGSLPKKDPTDRPKRKTSSSLNF